MRKEVVLGVDTGADLVHTSPLRENRHAEGSDTVLIAYQLERSYFLDVVIALGVHRGEDHLHSDVFRLDTTEVDLNLAEEEIFLGKNV